MRSVRERRKRKLPITSTIATQHYVHIKVVPGSLQGTTLYINDGASSIALRRSWSTPPPSTSRKDARGSDKRMATTRALSCNLESTASFMFVHLVLAGRRVIETSRTKTRTSPQIRCWNSTPFAHRSPLKASRDFAVHALQQYASLSGIDTDRLILVLGQSAMSAGATHCTQPANQVKITGEA